MIGTRGPEKMNENVEVVVGLCVLIILIIGQNAFRQRGIHKATWTSQDHIIEEYIYYICVRQKFRTLTNIRAQRGADTAFHQHLVLARLQLKLKKRDVKRSIRTIYIVDFPKKKNKKRERERERERVSK